MRATLRQRRDDRVDALFVQTDAFFDPGLFIGATFDFDVLVFFHEPCQGLFDQSVAIFQIAPRDRLAFRMAAEPACAVTQQLFDLFVSDLIMLVVVERRDQYVQMREQIAQSAIGA